MSKIVILLTILFIGLKLAGIGVVGTWSWWGVLSPLWIYLLLWIGLLLFVIILICIEWIEEFFSKY